MLLIYTPQATHRVKYIFNLIFKSILGVDYNIISDVDSFSRFDGPKISYAQKPIGKELFFQSSNLLFETGIKKEAIPFAPQSEEQQHMASERYTNSPLWGAGGLKAFVLLSDPFALAFLLVSRYEEYLPFTADRYGRFTAKQSLAYKNNFLQKPVVNIWARKIREMISTHYPGFAFPVKKYSYTPTIDIDNGYAYYGKGLARTMGGYARAMAKSDWDDFFKRKNVLSGKEKDPYDTYHFQMELHKKYNLKPIYFFLLGDWGTNDKNLPHTNPGMRSLIKTISQYTETGIHPSFASNQNFNKVEVEKKRLREISGKEVTKSRQHFLMLRFPQTYRNLIACGITDDYTMGFADETGFRAGICTSYNFYDLKKEKDTNLIIHPFAVMDGTLNNYLKLSPEQAIEKVKNIVKEIKNVNGEFITVWHNETLSDWREWKEWKNVYEEIIKLAL